MRAARLVGEALVAFVAALVVVVALISVVRPVAKSLGKRLYAWEVGR